MMDIYRLKELAGINGGDQYQSHYFLFKYYDKWYCYTRSESTKSTATAKNQALYKAADAFKEIYNSSKPVLVIKKEMAGVVKFKEYPDYISYFDDFKKIPLESTIIL